MSSKLFRVNLGDLGKGLVVAVFAAVFTSLAGALNTPGFDFSAFDYSELFRVAMTALVAYLGKNFLTDSEGIILGKADKK